VPRCDRRQREKVKSHILTDFLIKIALDKKYLQGQLQKMIIAKGLKNIEIKIKGRMLQKINLFFK